MLRLLGFLFLLFIGYSIFTDRSPSSNKQSAYSPNSQQLPTSPNKTTDPAPEPDQPKMTDADCRQDLQCYADKFQSYATVECRDPVERLAKNDFQWTDKWYEEKFNRRKWDDKSAGRLTYIGDRIKFQNGYGAWAYMKYYCIYDTLNKRVIDAFAIEGRFGD